MSGNELKRLRLTLNMTQVKFAEILGYANYQRIIELEKRGRRKIPKRVEKLIELLKLYPR